MFIDSKYVKQFPHLAMYLQGAFQQQARTPLMIEAASLFGQMNKEQYLNAIRPGTLPYVLVTDISDCRAGAFAPKLPEWVVIDVDVVTEYESGKIRRFTCKDGSFIFAPGLTLLHELMHWGDWNKDHKMLNGPGPFPLQEAGNDFEVFVLGGLAEIVACREK